VCAGAWACALFVSPAAQDKVRAFQEDHEQLHLKADRDATFFAARSSGCRRQRLAGLDFGCSDCEVCSHDTDERAQVIAFAPTAVRVLPVRRGSSSCVNMELEGAVDRRRALQTAAAGLAGLTVLPIAPAFAIRQTKQELMVQAAAIQKEVKGMVAGFELAEADWETKDKIEAQKEYNVLQTVLRGGQLSQLRGTCFHLYRDHIVDSQKFKEAEKQYKEMLKTVEKLNVLVLKASRAELKVVYILMR
jgi:hypothetical protein